MTNRDAAKQLLKGISYLEDLLTWYDSLPHIRIEGFCRRQRAPLGTSNIHFLIQRAEELETEVENLKAPSGGWED